MNKQETMRLLRTADGNWTLDPHLPKDGSFCYILGTMILGQSSYAVIGYWPISTAFQMITVLAFYGFAKSNGALEVVTRNILYSFRHRPQLLPFVILLVILTLGAIAGPLSVNSFMPVLTFAIAEAAGWNPVMFSVLCCIGAVIGSSLPFSEIGVYMFNALVNAGYDTAAAEGLTWKIGATAWLVAIIFFVILYVGFKDYKGGNVEMEKPGKANAMQKKTSADALWVAESNTNSMIRFQLDALGEIIHKWFPDMRTAS